MVTLMQRVAAYSSATWCRASAGIAWVALLAIATGSARCQATSFATALQPLIATTLTQGTQTQPAGPLPAQMSMTAYGLGESAQIGVSQFSAGSLPPGGQAWLVTTILDMSITHQFSMVRACSLSGRVRIHFSSPTPVSGLLYLMPRFSHSGPFQVFSGDMTVDMDGNGVPDYSASTRARRSVERAVTIDATGLDLDFDMVMSAYWNAVGWGTIRGHAVASWEVAFLPNTYGLETRQVGCVPMVWGRDPYGGWQLSFGCNVPSQLSPPIVAAIFLLGISEQNVVLPTQPFCSLFVADPAVVMPTLWYSTTMSLTPPNVPLPPGLTFYCQAAWLDAQNQIITSDSVRTI